MNTMQRALLGALYMGAAAALERMSLYIEDQRLVLATGHRGNEAEAIDKAINYMNRAAGILRLVANRATSPRNL